MSARRWWSTGYAVRLGLAIVLASTVIGGIVGPADLVINRLEADGMLWYPDWMYWQAAWMNIIVGIVIAGSASFGAVLLSRRPTRRRDIARRLCVGPLIAGTALVILGLLWGAVGLPRILIETAFACAIFVGVGALFRVLTPVPDA
ncbi:hypothetical protein [Microbacterium sp. RURRCA19A]|uniref:hypothetical protein n=1 Tax=Microbacterium sp. RURRCA19A TaxID=1907391 RepID=UPI0009704632|nr:hypothetical protein [Microbacterium sp. RURRCA19A]